MKSKETFSVHAPTYRLTSVRLNTTPNFDMGGGSNPYFQLRYARSLHDEEGVWSYKESKLYNQKDVEKKVKFYKDVPVIDLKCEDRNILVHGDVKFLFFDYDEITVSGDDKMFHFWINTNFIQEKDGGKGYLKLEKKKLDKVSRCKIFFFYYIYYI